MLRFAGSEEGLNLFVPTPGLAQGRRHKFVLKPVGLRDGDVVRAASLSPKVDTLRLPLESVVEFAELIDVLLPRNHVPSS